MSIVMERATRQLNVQIRVEPQAETVQLGKLTYSFNNFYEFVEKLDNTYKDDWGMVKVSYIDFPSLWRGFLFPSFFFIVGCSTTRMETKKFRL